MNCANHPERERTAFCQNCGKALCQECTRVVGTAVYCEPCLAARLAGATSSGATPPPPGGVYPDPASAYAASGAMPPPIPGAPNPGLAALLGFIPGVGAMYNGQYAKGIVHLIVFAVLVSLADDHGIFGLFIAGWVFYQVFEAYQTAVARRDGTPLPNPFGLNDLGERLGFGKSWAAGASGPAAAAPFTPFTPPDASTPPAGTYVPPAAPFTPPGPAPAQAQWETPWTNYVQPNYVQPNYGQPNYPPPAANPYMNPPAFDPNAPFPAPRNRFPVGAIWLIGLGVIFLIGNSGIFHSLPMHFILPIFLIGLGVWIFVHRMTGTGATLSDDGTAFYRRRLFCALRGSAWVILVGVLFLLSNFHILSWGHSWPLFIILAGLLTFFERTVNASAVPAYPAPPYQAPPPASSSTSIVPSSAGEETPNQNNQEGR